MKRHLGSSIQRRTPVAALVAVALAVPLLTENPYYLRVATLTAIAVILTSSLNLIYGYAGQISIGHIGFYAVGAYGTAVLTTKYGVNFWLAWVAATALTGALAWVVGRPVLRLRHFYLAVATLGFGVVVHVVINRWLSVTGGPTGVLGLTRPSLFGRTLGAPGDYYLFVAVVALAVLLLLHVVIASPFGRVLQAIREGEVPVATLGIDPGKEKLRAFTLSGALAGLAGGLFTTLDLYIGPGSFTVEHSILLLAVLVIGGLGRESGAVVGGFLLILLTEVVRAAGEYQHLVYATALLLATLYLPEGVAGLPGRLIAWRTHARRPTVADAHVENTSAPPRPSPLMAATAPLGGPLLEVTGLTVRFGGFVAVDDLDVTVRDGELVGLIGSNGAGKSTFINAVTGIVEPSGGALSFASQSLRHRSIDEIAALGITRTFQTTRLFSRLTVLDNVLVAATGRGGEDHARELLDLVELDDVLDRPAGSLPFGRRRLLELARALATQPRLLLLDEPAAGLNEGETFRLGETLLRLRAAGLSLLLVEHDLGLVMGVSDRVVAMGFGRKLAEGSPEEVQEDERVIESYLGTRTTTRALTGGIANEITHKEGKAWQPSSTT